MMQDYPLVSIIVVTYNSSKYVLETLESAKAQTYQNIELIITDDCSTDNTVEICSKWIAENNVRFKRTELLTTNINRGIPANCNRGLKAALGQWLKFIAGDDILIRNCITDFVKLSIQNEECKVAFGNANTIVNNKILPGTVQDLVSASITKQKEYIYKGFYPISPTMFIENDLLVSIGGFNEKYFLIEDLPLWITLVNNNIRLYFVNNFVVNYRIHSANTTKSNKFVWEYERVLKQELFAELLKSKLYGCYLHYWNHLWVEKLKVYLGIRNEKISKFIDILTIRTTYRRVKSIIKFR